MIYWLFSLVGPLVALLLAVRAAVSRDARWRRIAGAAFAVLPLLVPAFFRLLPAGGDPASAAGRYFPFAHVFAPAAAGAYLFAWAFRSSDPRPLRLASAIVGGAAFLPLLLVTLIGFAVSAR